MALVIYCCDTTMPELRDFSWWPSAWLDESGALIGRDEITNAILKNVRRADRELILIAQNNGHMYTAIIGDPLPMDIIVLLRHILLQFWGEPVSAVEHIEIDLAALQKL